jgi:hypothetical protein
MNRPSGTTRRATRQQVFGATARPDRSESGSCAKPRSGRLKLQTFWLCTIMIGTRCRQTAGVLFITWVGFFGSGVSAMEQNDNVNVDGSWAYTARDNNGGMEHMAVTRAAEDDAWLLLACSPDERLTVSVIHNEQFPFPLKDSSSVKIRSNNVPAVSVEGKSIKNDPIFVDPKPMRHIMPLLLQDYYPVVSFPERDGAMHDYTFTTQPNDLALAPIRSHCFDS